MRSEADKKGLSVLAALALFASVLAAAAPEVAAHTGLSQDHHRRLGIYENGHNLNDPYIVSSPASGDTYWPGETITVLVPWGRTISGCDGQGCSIRISSVGTVELTITVGSASRKVTARYEDRESRYGRTACKGFSCSGRRLWFDYVVQKGDRDTDGISLAQNALNSPGNAESGITGSPSDSQVGASFELEKQLHGFPNQAGHKVDTPAPSFSGVSGPTVTFYREASINYRLPTIANADEAYNVTYSVSPALPAGYLLNSSTATITGTRSRSTLAVAQSNYTLRATDGHSRTAELTFSLEVKTDGGIESITITSDPGTDKTYGKTTDFGNNDTINVTVDFTHRLGTLLLNRLCLNIRIGANTRRQCTPTWQDNSAHGDKLYFSYAVQESDWDGDGISFPNNPLDAPGNNTLRFRLLVGGTTQVNRNFGAIPNDPNHKVRGRQTTPTFGTTVSPAYSWIKDNVVSQALPGATLGDGGVTYAIEPELPAGLTFAAGTRTISGTPTAAQARATYTLAATDGDGDKGTLRFSVEIQELLLSISSPSVTEGAAGETATLAYDVTLNRAPGRQVTVEYAAAANPGTAASGADYTAFTGGTLTFAAAETSKTVEVTVTGDALDEPDETVRVALATPSGATLGRAAVGTGTITDDDETPTLVLALSAPDPGNPDTITESGTGNATTVTASLDGGTSGQAITVTVAVASGYAALAPAGGYRVSGSTLTIAAGATASTGTVTITAVDDAIDSRDKTATVSGTVAGGHGLVDDPSALTLTIADDDAQPKAALSLIPASITESGGVTTVTATLSNPSAAAVTVTVAATAVAPAVAGDFTLSPANVLTVAAGQTTSAGIVTVTAVGNATDEPDKQVTVSGSASGTRGAVDPPAATLTIRDDDGAPTVSLVLSSSSVSENGGQATVTAALNGTSSQAVTVTVSAAAVAASGAVADDFALSGTRTLTIAANATTSTGTVTITANDNLVDSPNKRVTVSGTATGGNGIAAPASLPLTLADDEVTPTVRLALAPASIAEANGVSTVTAALSGESSEAVTVTVSAAPGAGTDFTQTGTTLTIAAGSTVSTGTVTVRANPDVTDSADKQVAVSGRVSGGNGAEAPAAATLTIRDDDRLPTARLVLSASTIDESGSGNVTTVTAALSHPSGEAVEIAVSVAPTLPAVPGDFSLSANPTLTIAAGSTTSTGTVTITAVDNARDEPNKAATVSGMATGGRGVVDPDALPLTVRDDDDAPRVTLWVLPTSIAENGGRASVTATLSRSSSADTTITVTPVAGFYEIGRHYVYVPGTGSIPTTRDPTIVIAAGSTANASDVALVAAVDNDVYEGSAGRLTTVTATVANTQGTGAVTGVALTLTDDEPIPTLSLVLSPASVSETGGVSSVTARLSGASSEAVTVTVGATAGTGAEAADFTLSQAKTLTIAAGQTTSAGDVTVTANGNDVDSPDKSVTVSGTVASGSSVTAPANVTLTLEDDEALPTVALALSSTSITEDGGVSTVTATLSGKSSEAVTVTVGATAGTGAVAADFDLSTAKTLTIAAGATTSTGTVTVTANDNDVDVADKSVTVSGTVTGGNGVVAPSNQTLTLTDDDTAGMTFNPSTIELTEQGAGKKVAVSLDTEPPGRAWISLHFDDGLTVNGGLAPAGYSYSFTPTTWETPLTVTVGASGDADHEDETLYVRYAVAGYGPGNVLDTPTTRAIGVTVNVTDNDKPVVTLALSATAIGENGEVATVTATLNRTASAATTVTVGAAPGTNAVEADFTLSEATTLTIAAGATTSTGTVTVTANDNDVDAPNKQVTVSGTVTGGDGATVPAAVTLTLTDDDAAPGVTLGLAAASIAENGGATSVTATLSHPSSAATTVTVTAVSGFYTVGSDATVVIAAGDTTATADVAAINAVDDDVHQGSAGRSTTVTATAANDQATAESETMAVTGATLTLTDDDTLPTVALDLSASRIDETGAANVTTVTATLSGESSEVVTLTVSATPGARTDFDLSTAKTLTIAAGSTTSAGTVTITARDNLTDSPDKSVTVSATAMGGNGVMAPSNLTLTITDDEVTPTVTLALSSTSITEENGVTTVTATLSGKSSEAVTVTVGATAGTGAVEADFDLSTAKTLTIAAGSTTSAGPVTVRANGNDVDSPDKSVTVSGTVTGGNGVVAPADVTLTLEDDEVLPTVTLALSSTSITEENGMTTVTATLSGKSSEAVMVTVGATAGTGAVAADFDLSTAKTLTIAAGSTTSTGPVTVTANGNAVDSPDKSVTVSGTTTGGNGVLNPENVTLTLEDDEVLPTVTLALSAASVSENGGVASVTATLSGASSEAVTVTVGAAAGTNAVGADFTLSQARTLTIAAGSTASTGDVTVTANDNMVSSAHKQVTVSGTVTGGNGVVAPSNVTLTLTDDDAPLVTLALSATSIAENGGVATVTATLTGVASEATTVTVGAAPGTNAVGADFTLSQAKTLTVAAGATTSTGTVTVRANDNDTDAPNKQVTVSGTVMGGDGAAAPADVTLTLTDDEVLPTVTLALSSTSVTEENGVTTVTATLSGESSEAVTVTVGATAGTGAVAADFDLSTAKTLTIAAGSTTSTGAVTVRANGNAVDSPDKAVTVSGTVTGGNGVVAPADVTLTLTDDEVLPTVTLALSSTSVTEENGVSTVTATLSGESSEAVTVTVGAAAGTGAVAGDFDLSTARMLTIAAGSTTSTGAVTVRANGNAVDSPDKAVTVSGTVTGGNGVVAPSSVTLTLTDDEVLPTVALDLSASSISESGGVSTVTARLSGASSEAVTVTVGAAAGTGAVAGDFDLSTARTLTIAAGSTTSTGDVTVRANGNAVDSPNKAVTVSGTVTGGNGVVAPSSVTLTLTDDEVLPTVTLALSSTSVTEENGVSTVTARLSGESSEAVTVTVGAAAGSGAANADFDLSTARTLTIAAGSTTSTGAVTVRANGNAVDSPDKAVTVSGTVTGGNGVTAPSSVTLTLTDDEVLPTVALALSSTSITEENGVSTVTATLSGESSEAVTVTVGAAAGSGVANADFDLSTARTLTIAAGSTTSTGAVTVRANGNAVDSPDKAVTVSSTVTGGNGVTAPANVTLTLTDDEVLPTVTLALSSTSVTEENGVSTVTATLSGESSEAVTVTVGVAAGSGAANADFDLSTARTLTIAAGSTTSAGTVTVRANGNDVDSPDKQVTVSGMVTGGNGVTAPANVTLTLTDDEVLPTVTLALAPTSISETNGMSSVTARLSGASSEAVVVTVGAAAGTGAVAGDFDLSTARTLTIAAGSTTSAGTVTVRANGNVVDSPNKAVTVSGTVTGGNGVTAPSNVTLTLTDDEVLPTVTLALSSTSITEENGVSTVTARLSGASSEAVVVTVGAAAGTEAVAADFTLSTAKTLTIAAGSTTSAGTVTVRANGNVVDSPNKAVTVSGTTTGGNGVTAPSNVTLTLTDNDVLPTATLVLSAATIEESGTPNVSTVTARLSHGSSEEVIVTVSVSPVTSTGAMMGDYTLSSANALTIAAGSTASTGTVTVTAVDNMADEAHIQVTVSGSAAGGRGVVNPTGQTLTIRDDEGPPTATLVLSAATIGESGASNVTTVTARLNRASGSATTVTVAAAPGTNAVAGQYTLSAANALIIAAGSTTSTGTVTVTAVNDNTDAPNRSVTISGTANNPQGVTAPLSVTLTITDDDAAPDVTLSVALSSIPENGGSTTVSAVLSRPSSAATTVTVTAVANAYSVASGAGATIVIAAGDTANTPDTATITAVNNAVDAADNAVTVTGTAQNSQGVGTVTGPTLTITDDDQAGVAVSPATSASSRLRTTESAGTATFTVTLASEPTGNVVLDVASTNTAEGTVSTSALTFTTTTWNVAQTVTLTGVDDATATPPNPADGSQAYTVTLTVNVASTADAMYDALGPPPTAAVTVYAVNADNEYGLAVGPVSGTATEAGAAATFTVALRTQPAATVNVAVTSRDPSEGRASPASLTFTTGNWNTEQTVTATGVNDAIDDGDVAWNVRLDPSSSSDTNYNSLAHEDVSVTTTDDDAAPNVTLGLMPTSISENGGTTAVRATLTRASGAATTVTVTAVSGFYTVGTGAAGIIVIPPGQVANNADTATLTAVDDAVHQGTAGRSTTVTATAANTIGVGPVTGATLLLTDNEAAPGATLTLSDASIPENGGTSVVSATLSGESAAATTVTVTPVAGAYTVGADAIIAIAAGATAAAGDTVTITAVDNATDEPNRTTTVTATLANSRGTGSVTGATLTLEDNDNAPTVTLAVAAASIPENEGTTTVRATLSHPSSAATTVTVTALANVYTVATGAGATIIVAAGSTTSTDTATITAVDNAVNAADNAVTVAGTAQNTQGVGTVTGAALTITDDDTPGIAVTPAPSASARLRTTESEDAATFTVTLATEPAGDVVLDVASSDTAEGIVAPASLTFTPTTWNVAQTVTVTGQDDMPTATDPNPRAGNRPYTVTLTVNPGSTADNDYDVLPMVTVYAENADNEYGLDVNPLTGLTTTEAGGTATFTVALRTQPAAAVEVRVSSEDPSEGTASPGSLTFTPTNWNVKRTVTVTGVDDDIHDPDTGYTVVLMTTSSGDANYHGLDDEHVAVTTTDDEVQPTVTLVLTPPTIAEGGTATTVATVTATLSGKSNEAVTVTVSATAVAPAVAADFDLSDATTLTIAAGTTTSTGLVTVTAVDNAVDAPAEEDTKPVRVSATATGGNGVSAPGTVTLTIADDDTAGLVLAPTELALEEQTTGEDEATYTVRLATEPTGAVTVMVANEAVGNSNPAVVTVTSTTPLTFTMADWATAQPVMVTTVAEDADNYRHDMVDLKHTVSSADGKYNSLSAADVRVTVTDKDTPPMLRAGADTTVNGHTVTVTATQGDETAAAVVVTPPADLNGDLTVEIGPATTEDAVTASDATDTGAVRRRFSLGTGAARTVVDIEVTGAGLATVQADGLRICLPVQPALRTEAGGRALRLLYRPDGGEWTVLDPEKVEDEGERLCVTQRTFSEFAVAYQDAQPRFAEADRQLGLKTYLTGRAVNDELPGATGGDGGRTYTLTPALPAGLEHTQPTAGATHGGTITGTPTTPTVRRDYTLTATDEDRDTASITISIEVKPGIESRDLGLVLAGIGRTLATDAVEILGGRFGSAPASRLQITLGGQVLRLTEPTAPSPSSSSPSPLAGEGRGEGGQGSGEGRVESGDESGGPRMNPKAAGPSPWQQATGLALSVARALGINLDIPSSNSSPSPLEGEGRGEGSLLQGEGGVFQGGATRLGRFPNDIRRTTPTTGNLLRLQPVSGKDLLARSAFELPLTRTGDNGVPAWTLWGRGSAAGFAGQPEDGFKMDGTLYSGYLGVDYRHASLLMGLAVAHSTGEVSYERTAATKAGADVKLTSVLPYVHWQPSAGLGVWSLLGAGWGEMDLKLAGDSQTRSTRLNSWLGAVGGRQALTTWQGIDLAAKTDAFLTTVRAAGTAEVPEAQGHAQRVRFLVEGRTAVAVSQVSRLEPRVELGARWDSGTAEQGLGAELGGGVAYTLTDWGLSIDAQGRYLLVHEDGGFEDWGASVNVRLDPGAAGEGAYLTVAPVWGQASSGAEQLWSPATALSQASGPARPAAGWRPHRLEVDLGYGVALSDGQFLTPYGGLALAGPGSSRYRLGSRLALSSALAVNVEAERAEQPGQATAHGISIRLGWQW